MNCSGVKISFPCLFRSISACILSFSFWECPASKKRCTISIWNFFVANRYIMTKILFLFCPMQLSE
nr:unnamed protein product [Callosobruchus analis]CAI5857027.1 unnamed protein product [Callosobruchus analis]CAI5869223.1 unnamed protein product [Callosobruchus analis]